MEHNNTSNNQGREKLCDYVPPTDDNSILKGNHWYRINTKDANFYPNSSQKEAILQNSENHAGWSRTRVQQLNNQNDGFTYSISYWLNSYIISSKKKGQKQKKSFCVVGTSKKEKRPPKTMQPDGT